MSEVRSEPDWNREDDVLIAQSLAAAKRALLDAIQRENPLLVWLQAQPPLTPEQQRRNRKLLRRHRRRRWLRNHLPTVHLGPCRHADCW